jgi:hypothetical protein
MAEEHRGQQRHEHAHEHEHDDGAIARRLIAMRERLEIVARREAGLDRRNPHDVADLFDRLIDPLDECAD